MFNEMFWIGSVENRDDPEKLGRLQVRILNKYDDTKTIKTAQLPWAVPLQSVTSSAKSGVGFTPVGAEVGSFVMGFFLDGEAAQQPVILGSYAGYEDVTPLADGGTVTKSALGPEPASTSAPVYPLNSVLRTESGHIIEVDDTEGAERIHIYHKSGTYLEVSANGDFVKKSTGDDYTIIAGKEEIYVQADSNEEVEGNLTLTVGGSITISATGPVNLTSASSVSVSAPTIDLNSN